MLPISSCSVGVHGTMNDALAHALSCPPVCQRNREEHNRLLQRLPHIAPAPRQLLAASPAPAPHRLDDAVERCLATLLERGDVPIPASGQPGCPFDSEDLGCGPPLPTATPRPQLTACSARYKKVMSHSRALLPRHRFGPASATAPSNMVEFQI